MILDRVIRDNYTHQVDDGRPVVGVGEALVHEGAALTPDLVGGGVPQGAVEGRGRGDGQRRVGRPRQLLVVVDVGDAVPVTAHTTV